MKAVTWISMKSGPFFFYPGFYFLCENTPFEASLMLRGADFYPAQGSRVSQTFVSKSNVKRKRHLAPSAFRISRIETFSCTRRAPSMKNRTQPCDTRTRGSAADLALSLLGGGVLEGGATAARFLSEQICRA